MFAGHAHASVIPIVLTLLQSFQRCVPNQICGPHRQDVKTSHQLYFIAKNEIDNNLKVRFNKL